MTLALSLLAVGGMPLLVAVGEEGVTLGISSFRISGVEILDRHVSVSISYDASTCGNPWPPEGADPYGEIESLRYCYVKAYLYRDEDREKAEALVETAETLRGFSLFGITDITTAAPEGTVVSSSITGKIWFNESSPLSGEVVVKMEKPFALKYPTGDAYHMVVLSEIEYAAFNGVWKNIDGWGPLTVGGDGGEETKITLSGPETVTDLDTEMYFPIKVEGPTSSIRHVNYTFQYRDRAGSWIPGRTYRVTGTSGLRRTDTYLIDLAMCMGTPIEVEGSGMSLEMRLVAEAYGASGELAATSNTHRFKVEAPSYLISVTGPLSVSNETERATFRVTSAREVPTAGISTVWIFSYEKGDGIWATAGSLEKRGLSDIVVNRSSGTPAIGGWIRLAEESDKDEKGYLDMRAVAKVKSRDGTVLATADPQLFRAVMSQGGLTVTITGPVTIAASEVEAGFEAEAKGAEAEDVDLLEWALWYRKSDGEWTLLETVSRTVAVTWDMAVGGEGAPNLPRWRRLALEHGSLQGEVNSMEMRVQVEARGGERLLGSSSMFQFSVESRVTTRLRIIALGEKPVKHCKLVFRSGSGMVETTTNGDGYYDLPLSGLGGINNYTMDIHLEYLQGGRSYFSVRDGFADETLVLSFMIGGETVRKVNRKWESGDISPSLCLDEFERYDLHPKSWGAIYIHAAEALEFYKDHLGEEMTYMIPVAIYTRVDDDVSMAYRYTETQVGITIPGKYFSYESPWRPKNREYHEMSHFAMHSIYGGRWPKPLGPVIEERNHDGYINPSTSDSYTEGFAIFMAMIIGEHYGNWADNSTPDVCSTYGSLERDYEVWGDRGRHEEYAIAGLLWDLYDGQSQVDASRSQNMKNMWDKLLQYYDLNRDGELDRAELYLAGGAGVPYSEQVKEAESVMREVDLDEDDRLTEPELAKIERQDLLKHDANSDGKLDPGELEKLYREKPDDKASIEASDRNRDGSLDGSEIQRRAEGIASDLMSQQDVNGNGEIEIDEIAYLMARGLSSSIDYLPEEFTREDYVGIANDAGTDKLGGALSSLVKVILPADDDDPVDLSFKQIWSVLGDYQSDLFSVYLSLIEAFPDERAGIDEVFKAHGVFTEGSQGDGKWQKGEPYRDANGNGRWDQGEYFVDYPTRGFKYDEGEEIGRAANRYPQERGERRSTQCLPGHFVKTDNDHPFYQVTIEYYDNEEMESDLTWYESFATDNQNGMIYVQVPPPGYNATVQVEGRDVETGSPLVFTSHQFYEQYDASLERGYFTEHDFKLNQSGSRPSDGREEDEKSLPSWFVEYLPFLVKPATLLTGLLPESMAWLVPFIVIGSPVLVLLVLSSLVRRRSRKES